jgi:hypothetical protein
MHRSPRTSLSVPSQHVLPQRPLPRVLGALVFAGLALGAVGCTNTGAAPVYAIADWQVRCDSVMGMCAVPLARSVTGENAMGGNVVSCSVDESPDARVVSFRAGNTAGAGMPYRIEVTGARVPRGGGAVGGSTCFATITEGANRYTGRCGGAAPTTDQPCQVRIMFGYDDTAMSPTADVEIYCDHLPNESSGDQLRSVSSPLGGIMPADLRFFDCVGQTPD